MPKPSNFQTVENTANEATAVQKKKQSSLTGIEEIANCLRETLERHQGERQLIVIQDYPDPDALSSAWAYQLIAREYQIQTEIVYAGTLSHQENIALVKLAGIPAQRWTLQSLDDRDLSVYGGFVLLDSQGTTSQLTSQLLAAELPIIAIVDHHRPQEETPAEFIDLRPQVRATATILTQYIQAGLLHLDGNNQQHIRCATALMHGLRSDTDRLMQAREEDFAAAAYLSRFYDSQLLSAVLQSARSRHVMEAIERSLSNRVVINGFSISGIGYLRAENRDAIPQAADFLVTEENVHTAIVYALVRNEEEEREAIIGSLRTNKLTLDPDDFLKEAFGQDSQGRFFGGGRSRAGGFEIAIGFLSGFNDIAQYAKLKWEVFDAQIAQKLARLVNPGEDAIDLSR